MQSAPVGQIDDVFEFTRRAGEPVDVPDDEATDAAPVNVREHPLVLGWDLGARGADVVVDVRVDDAPSAPLGLRSAVLNLPRHAKAVVVLVAGDPGIDARPDFGHGRNDS